MRVYLPYYGYLDLEGGKNSRANVKTDIVEVADLKRLGKRLMDIRLSQNLTQAQLAKKVGSTQSWICSLENGRINPTIKLLARIVQALNRKLIIKID